MRLVAMVAKISDGIDWIMRAGTVLLTAGFTALIFATVLSRYVFDFSILFSQEVSKLLFIWACFFAATVTYKRRAHIRFDFAATLLGRRGVLATDLLINAASLSFFGLVLVESISYIRQIWETYFPLIEISQGWLYVAVLIAAAVFLVHNFHFFIESLLALKKWKSEVDPQGR